MDTTFLSCLLAISLIIILVIYLYQILPTQNNQSSNTSKTTRESFYPVIFDTCNINRTSGMPVHRVGPVINFHQSFNKYSPAIQSIIQNNNNGSSRQFATQIPEMGWRNLYLSHFNKNMVPNIDPFAGTPIRNFLDNLDNVDNIYRKCN